MKRFGAMLIVLLAIVASPAAASVVIAMEDVVLLARDGRIEARDAALHRVWTARGVRFPTFAVTSADGSMAAILDPVENRVAVIRGAETRIVGVGETPVDAAFLDDVLFVVGRGGVLTRIDETSDRSARIAPGSPRVATAGGVLLVYDAIAGSIARFDPASLATIWTREAPAFASDLETDGRAIHFVTPRSGELVTMEMNAEAAPVRAAAGATPVDVMIESPGTATRAAVLVIADPASKRLWRAEGAQSLAQAVGRGFVRGLLGLGLFSPRSASLPRGADRLFRAGGRSWAFENATGTLYRIDGDRVREVARDLRWGEFALHAGSLYIEENGALVSRPIDAR